MRDQNPELVQPEDWANPDSVSGLTTPLFLIHDGGGTTFAYHCLNPLFRFVYGIRNPHFHTGDRFEGGLPEMGRLYARWIRSQVAKRKFPAKKNLDGSVDILLGGWSLGGLLSMEVAKQLADDGNISVVGILMVDSIYPVMPAEPVPTATPDLSEEGKSRNQILSQRSMTEARRMVHTWEIPTWNPRLSGKRPPAVLLRATKCIPTGGSEISKLDLRRGDKMLGWGEYDGDMFDEVIDVEGHHFDLFAHQRILKTTEAMRRGLDRLDNVR